MMELNIHRTSNDLNDVKFKIFFTIKCPVRMSTDVNWT